MVTPLKKLTTLLLAATLTACAAPTSSTGLPPTTSVPDTSMLSTATAVLPTATPTPNPLAVQVVQTWTGEGNYRLTGKQSGMDVVNGYTFMISFRMEPDGTIAGTGTLQKVEASQEVAGARGIPGVLCKDPESSSLSFPPMQVTGTVNPAAAGQPNGTFLMNIVVLPSTNTSQFVCTWPMTGTWKLDAARDQGFSLVDIEIAAMDGAEANGEEDLGGSVEGLTSGQTASYSGSYTWELQIHRQSATVYQRPTFTPTPTASP